MNSRDLIEPVITAFRSTAVRFDWFVTVDVQLAKNFTNHLKTSPNSMARRVKWEVFKDSFPLAPERFRPDATLIEELKAAARKSSYLPGNWTELFQRFSGGQFAFRVWLHRLFDGFLLIHLEGEPIRAVMSVDEMISLSERPSLKPSELRFVIEKIAAYLSTGDSKARWKGKLSYLPPYPVLHVTDWEPRDRSCRVIDNVPWHLLAEIGTRHRDIRPDNTKLLPEYRAKNYTFRDEVCVVDKQSTLIVSNGDYVETETIRYCVANALQLRQLLYARLNQDTRADRLNPTAILSALRSSIDAPFLMTDSETFRRLWRIVLTELRVSELAERVQNGVPDISPSIISSPGIAALVAAPAAIPSPPIAALAAAPPAISSAAIAPCPAPVSDDFERETLWRGTFRLIYNTVYSEIEIATYIRRLEGLNVAAIVLSTVTSVSGVGALIAKLTVWTTPAGAWIWAALLVIAAIAEGARRAINPTVKLRGMQKLDGDLRKLRADLDLLRDSMKNPLFSIEDAKERKKMLAAKHAVLDMKCPISLLLHLSVRRKCQAETTLRLKDYL